MAIATGYPREWSKRAMAAVEQILTVAQMQAAELALIDGGTSVDQLMQAAGRGAAEYVWRMAAGRSVTVLCGPGNNGGDGYVIAAVLRERGLPVNVVAPIDPKTDAAKNARDMFGGAASSDGSEISGGVFVDCMFGSGLARPLSDELAQLLRTLAGVHDQSIAIDLPSGIESDSGALLNEALPRYDLTISLGAWKFAHFLMPAMAQMGERRLIDIGCELLTDAAIPIGRPNLSRPARDAHKYKRGLLAVVGGRMPGASLLACMAAQGAGAGYVKLFADGAIDAPPDLVVDQGPLSEVLTDDRNNAILIGPGLGRDATARERLAIALADPVPVVLDADALVLLGPRSLAERKAATIATPHEGELAQLEKAFDCAGEGTKVERARALAAASAMVIVAKGPDTVVAAPDGRIALAHPATSWLSVAGTGDVLAGILASRMATGEPTFDAACQAVWLHGEAARIAGRAFTAEELARSVSAAYAACL